MKTDKPTDGRSIIGHQVAVVALSRHRSMYAPMAESSIFAIFPELDERRGRASEVVDCLVDLRLLISDGKIVGRCAKWWDVQSMLVHHQTSRKKYDKPYYAYCLLKAALDRTYMSPFGKDLPILIDISSGAIRDLDWEAIEYDICRGMNGQIPFKYTVSDKWRALIDSEMPFLDVTEHFRSVVHDGNLMISLVRQLLDQYTQTSGPGSMLPARWVGKVFPDDTLIAQTGIPSVIIFSDPGDLRVRVGALDVKISRDRPDR